MTLKCIFLVACFLALWISSHQDEVNMNFIILDESLRVYCDNGVTLDNVNNVDTLTENNPFKTVIIDSCAPPNNGSYADVFKALNFDTDTIRAIHLVNPPNLEGFYDPRRPQSKDFSDLHLEELKILNHDAPNALLIDLEFLKDLPFLTNFTLDRVDVKDTFPNTSLEKVELFNGTLYGDITSHCQGFKVLRLVEFIVAYGYRNLKRCEQLVELTLEHMEKTTTTNELESVMLRQLPKSLRNLTVRYSGLRTFPNSFDLFSDSVLDKYNSETLELVLTHLDISHNELEDDSFISSYKALESLDVSHNNFSYVYYYLPNLIEVKADNNNFEDYCKYQNDLPKMPEQAEYLKSLPLKQISASGTGMRELCFKEIPLSNLGLLNLTNNNITVLDYRKLYNVSGENFVVDLRQNPLNKVELTEDDYEALKRNDSSVASWRKIRVITDAQFPCDCTNAWFTRAMHEGLLKVEGASCDDGLPLEPRASYALQGCGAACEGFDGCSTASSLYSFMKNKDNVISPFSGQNSLWWLYGQAYDKFVHKA